MKKPLLSIGMIIKNEIRCLERCLKSLEPLRKAIPCELVIADTGSTDGSREVAAKYVDILFDFTWVNDFSAARNAVLERCTGEWYLTVDADEWLEDIEELVGFLTGPNSGKFNRAMVNHRDYLDADFSDYTDAPIPRMGKLLGGLLRYRFPIHEVPYFTDGRAENTLLLSYTYLHHDGYLFTSREQERAKKERNMALLRLEQEKDPENLRTLNQCIESAVDDRERQKYMKLSLAVLNDPQKRWEPHFAVLYKNCLKCRLAFQEYDLVEPLLEQALAACPGSCMIQLDGEAYAAIAAYARQDWACVTGHAARWEQALSDIEAGKDLHQQERLYASYMTRSSAQQSLLRTLAASAHAQLGEHEAAAALLPRISVNLLEPANQIVLVNAVLMGAHTWPQGAAAWLKEFWETRRQQAEEEQDPEKRQEARALLEKLREALRRPFPLGQEPGEAASILADMGDCAPGQSARILLSQSPDEITCLLEQVTHWTELFPEAYLHLMELELPLPASFFRQNWEDFAALAAQLAQAGGVRMVRVTARWLTCQPAPETPAQLTWLLDVVTAAIQNCKALEDIPLGHQLCTLYIGLSSTYLNNFYNPELLNQDDIMALPGMHRFAWYCQQALAAWEGGDELGYVRSLRAGLDTAPAMKDMVDFLLEHKPKTAAQRQLEELAEQVRAVLAQYPADDPAVTALKRSTAYLRVAPLLEHQGVSGAQPQTQAVPVSPAPLEEALAGSREEIAASIRENIRRWGQELAEKRTSYWARYPLWGKDTEEVVENLSAALSSHGADFRWLFDRLGDEQSRRVLTAVVRSWRFYETEPLKQVLDQTYDDYFDLSLLHCDANEVVADLGAFIGDTFLSYVKNYSSMSYRRYYCYEITRDSFDALTKVTAAYPRVVLCRKGAGDGPGVMALDVGADASANTLTTSENTAETVEIVALDDDISEPLTLIKMDIEGAEQSALRGCARHIREARPKLALSVYHNFEDLWKLPRMIDELAPGYRFYLRYHGGNLWPSEITLLALPE